MRADGLRQQLLRGELATAEGGGGGGRELYRACGCMQRAGVGEAYGAHGERKAGYTERVARADVCACAHTGEFHKAPRVNMAWVTRLSGSPESGL